jgi:autotransporter-associated beta strand protein
LTGSNATTFTGTIRDGAATTRVVKGGSSTLTFGSAQVGSGNNPVPNLNTFTGGFVLRSGTVTLNSTTALGGFDSVTSTNLELQGGTLLLQPGGVGPLATIIGNPAGSGVNVIVNGTSTAIATDNNGGLGGTGVMDQIFQFNDLTIGNSTFASTPSTDNQSIRFVGNISGGNASVFNVTTAIGNTGRSVLELTGVIRNTGSVPFALNKIGTGAVRITGGSNTFSGGINVFAGVIQVAASSGNPLGTGPVTVYPGGILQDPQQCCLAGSAGAGR